MKKAIVNGRLILKDKVERLDIIYDRKIIDIGQGLDVSDCQVLDADGAYVSPGFINIHIHGAEGSDVMDGSLEAVDTISKSQVKDGVTSFLATTMTMSEAHILKSFDAVKDYMTQDTSGAKVLGIHVEGPFINADKKGAQDERYIIAPKYELIENHTDEIKLMTVAPEVEGTLDFVQSVHSKHGIEFSLGHSNATYEQALEAYDKGIKSTTHLFNGMSGLHHRKPGVVGAVLKRKPYFEVIADTVHFHEALIEIFADAIGKDKMILITDAMCACRMPQGKYELGGQEVTVDESSARLNSGALAGSILRMNQAIANLRKHTSYEINEIVNMASLNPATMLGLKGLGSIQVNNQADLVLFDENIEIIETIVDGITRFRKD